MDELPLASARQIEMAHENIAGILSARIAITPGPPLLVPGPGVGICLFLMGARPTAQMWTGIVITIARIVAPARVKQVAPSTRFPTLQGLPPDLPSRW